jgi:hypothetical protein
MMFTAIMAHNSTTLTPEQLAAKEAYAAETNLPRILGVTTTIHAIALVFVVLRIYARVVVLRAFGWDDAVMIPAAVSISPFTAAAIWFLGASL